MGGTDTTYQTRLIDQSGEGFKQFCSGIRDFSRAGEKSENITYKDSTPDKLRFVCLCVYTYMCVHLYTYMYVYIYIYMYV